MDAPFQRRRRAPARNRRLHCGCLEQTGHPLGVVDLYRYTLWTASILFHECSPSIPAPPAPVPMRAGW
jgi:hypothetical protein